SGSTGSNPWSPPTMSTVTPKTTAPRTSAKASTIKNWPIARSWHAGCARGTPPPPKEIDEHATTPPRRPYLRPRRPGGDGDRQPDTGLLLRSRLHICAGGRLARGGAGGRGGGRHHRHRRREGRARYRRRRRRGDFPNRLHDRGGARGVSGHSYLYRYMAGRG